LVVFQPSAPTVPIPFSSAYFISSALLLTPTLQAEGGLWCQLFGSEAYTIVQHGQVDAPVTTPQGHFNCAGIGVPFHIGQRLLHDAEQVDGERVHQFQFLFRKIQHAVDARAPLEIAPQPIDGIHDA